MMDKRSSDAPLTDLMRALNDVKPDLSNLTCRTARILCSRFEQVAEAGVDSAKFEKVTEAYGETLDAAQKLITLHRIARRQDIPCHNCGLHG